jgi:hypothetical protein
MSSGRPELASGDPDEMGRTLKGRPQPPLLVLTEWSRCYWNRTTAARSPHPSRPFQGAP